MIAREKGMQRLAGFILGAFFVGCLGACASTPASPITYASAMAKYYKADYSSALHDFQVLAREGDAQSKIQLAGMYAAGLGVPADAVTARILLTEVAKQDNPLAEGMLGDLLMDDFRDYAGAFEWYSKSAAQGYSFAYPSLWCMYKHGLGTPADSDKAAQCYALASQHPPELRFYRLRMVDAVESHKRYPPEAVADKAHGVVRISFEYYGGGKATHIEVAHSSGDKRLDVAGVQAVQEADFPDVPPELASVHRFQFDIDFSL